MGKTTPTTSTQSTQSSGSEKTLDSETPRTRRAYKKSSTSPSLRAFESFNAPLAQFGTHVMTTIDRIGCDSVDVLRTELQRLDNKCMSMEKEFQVFISNLDKAIEDYEKKKPTDLAANANNVISPEEEAANHSSSFKDNDTIDNIFTALNQSIGKIGAAINNKITKSMYGDQYSISLEKKLKDLKNMCEFNSKILEEIGIKIKAAIVQNEEKRSSNDKCIA